MNLDQLRQKFRVDADDLVTNPPLWENEWIAAWFTEAEAEAALRGRLIHETANSAVCQIAVTAGTATYTLHRSLYELTHLRFVPDGASTGELVVLKTREELDRIRPGWRDRSDRLQFAIQDDTRITLADRPSVNGVLHIEGYRVPLKALENDTDKPEIHTAHHRHLVNWVLFRAFSKPDSDGLDTNRAAKAEAAFADYFGPPVDADMRRATRSDEAQTNKVFWP